MGGGWSLVAQGRSLQGVGSGQWGGQTIEAGLPNIKGMVGGFGGRDGAFTDGGSSSDTWGGDSVHFRKYNFNASTSNPIYKDSCNTVQPPAYLVYIWRRTS